MKYCILSIIAFACIFVSCKKTNSFNTNVLFYNGTWSLPALTAAWNSNTITTTAIAQGQSSGTADKPYLQEPAGTNLITFKAGTSTLANGNIYTTGTNGTSFIFFDTSASVSSIAILQLTDVFTQPDTAMINYRFIDLSPDTMATADVWFVNGTTDSLRLDTAAAFIGITPDAASIQTFTALTYHGEAYTIKIKKTGTEQILATIPNYVFTVKGIYSIIFSGLSNGTGNAALKLSVLHHQT